MTSLLSGLPFSGQGGDRLVSGVVSAAVAALFKRSDRLEASVRAEPLAKLLSGSIDGFDLIGKGLQLYNGLQISSLELYSQAVAIDFSQIFQAKVKLRQSVKAAMRVVLTEADLSASFNTAFIQDKLRLLRWNGIPLQLRQVKVDIPQSGRLRIAAESSTGIRVDFTASIAVKDQHCIRFVEVVHEGDPALGEAIVTHANGLLDLDKFALQGTRLRVERVRLQDQQITFLGAAHIDHFPHRNG